MRTDGAPRPRFEVYVIDSGWPTPTAEVVRRSMPLFAKYLRRHAVYILTPDQSTQFLRKHPQLLGKDPIIAVLDREAIRRESAGGIGARLLPHGEDTASAQKVRQMAAALSERDAGFAPLRAKCMNTFASAIRTLRSVALPKRLMATLPPTS